MKTFIVAICCLALCACAARKSQLGWRVKDMVLTQAAFVDLQAGEELTVATMSTRTLQQLMLAHLRISRSAGIDAELWLIEGEEPNAYAGFANQRAIIAINLGMVKLIGDDVNQYAGLLGHEAAHWSKGHIDASQLRSKTLQVIGTVVSLGMSAAGVPASGLITTLGLDLIDASYSRDQEREADAASIEYVIANKYDPQAMVGLFEKMTKNSSGLHLPFLSSHPSDRERIENFKALIAAKKPSTDRQPAE